MTMLTATPVAPSCGAVVRGVDLAELDEESFGELQELWMRYHVLFFPEQELAPQQHRAFAGRFGPLEIHPHGAPLSPDLPDVMPLHSEKGGRADVWHTDVTYTPSPPIAAIVRYVDGPEVGGDTMWSNMHLAYEQLSDPMRDLVDGMTALHVSTLDDEINCEHPVVVVHPVTGRRSLYVNRLFTRGLRQLLPGESKALLDYLCGWCERPEITCRWSWSPGDVVMWDNRCVQHYAINDYDAERLLHRCMVLGDPPRGGSPRWDRPAPAKASSSVGYAARTGEPIERPSYA